MEEINIQKVDTLVFDFDHTISIGNGPVLAYAEQIQSRQLAQDAEFAGFAEEVSAMLTDYPAGDYPGLTAKDAYFLVHELALKRGVPQDLIDESYYASRALLATEQAPIFAPEGLAEYLKTVKNDRGDSLRVVLVTNAPAERIPEALSVIGLDQSFDEVHTSAKKPLGMIELIRPWLSEGRVLSIGDIWVNDLAPVQELGGHTAYITSNPEPHQPDFWGQDVSVLLPRITEWLDLPATSDFTSE
ncbi:MAG: HAD family hydrolase [Microbacteriaceae bacterium]